MSDNRVPIFFTGATGYIGGSVLIRLLEQSQSLDITALVRSSEKAQKLETFGVQVIRGSLDDHALVEELSSKAHVIIDTADSDNVEATRAILRGIKKRNTETGDVPIYIHTSGTGELADDAKGNRLSDVIYDDTIASQIEALPATAVHRDVDLEIVAADSAGYVKSYIVMPGLIYGIPDNPLVDAGIQHPNSIAIPALIKVALDRKQPGIVGQGVSRWPNISVDDTANIYIALYNAIREDPDKVPHGREGYYFGENGEHDWKGLSRIVGQALVELGLITNPEPSTFTEDELIKYFGSVRAGNFFGTNARCKANRSRSIGWKPQHTTDDMFASIKPEIESIRKQLPAA